MEVKLAENWSWYKFVSEDREAIWGKFIEKMKFWRYEKQSE